MTLLHVKQRYIFWEAKNQCPSRKGTPHSVYPASPLVRAEDPKVRQRYPCTSIMVIWDVGSDSEYMGFDWVQDSSCAAFRNWASACFCGSDTSGFVLFGYIHNVIQVAISEYIARMHSRGPGLCIGGVPHLRFLRWSYLKEVACTDSAQCHKSKES